MYRWTVSELGSAAAFHSLSSRPHFWRILVELGVTWRPAPIYMLAVSLCLFWVKRRAVNYLEEFLGRLKDRHVVSRKCCGNGCRQAADSGAHHDDVQLDGGFWLHLHIAIHGYFVACRRRCRHCTARASEEKVLGEGLPRALDLCKHGRVGLLLGREVVRTGRVEMPHCEKSARCFPKLVSGRWMARCPGNPLDKPFSFGFTQSLGCPIHIHTLQTNTHEEQRLVY